MARSPIQSMGQRTNLFIQEDMIKGNELRIGNYMYFDGRPSLVKEIDEQGVVVFIKETDEEEWIDLFQFTPIPLTEEILLKCGFEKHGDFWYVLGDIKIEVTTRGYFRFSGYVRIYHLHQIQNLYFALTGQELNIEL